MTGQRIESIDIEGYLSIRSAHVELRDLNILVGANGSGKSNFISALELLGRIADRELGWYVGRDRGGASQLMHGWAKDGQTRLGVDFGRIGYEALLAGSSRDEFVFADERVWQELPAGERRETSLGRGHQETHLDREAHPPGYGSAVRSVLDRLHGCRVYHFHDTAYNAPMKRFADDGDNLALAPDAANLAPFLTRMQAATPIAYQRIVSAVQQVAPFFGDFVLESESPGRMRLRWRQLGHRQALQASALSDGTLRYACLTALLLQPELPPVVVLDEPELGLHPYAVVQLASMLQTASRRAQVIVATQSV